MLEILCYINICLYKLSCLKAYEVLSARQDIINTLRQSYLAIYFFFIYLFIYH